jgi:hypothetical protein
MCLNEKVKLKIRAAMPKGNLAILVHSVQEFMTYHQKVEGEGFDRIEGEEIAESLTRRIQDVVDGLRKS